MYKVNYTDHGNTYVIQPNDGIVNILDGGGVVIPTPAEDARGKTIVINFVNDPIAISGEAVYYNGVSLGGSTDIGENCVGITIQSVKVSDVLWEWQVISYNTDASRLDIPATGQALAPFTMWGGNPVYCATIFLDAGAQGTTTTVVHGLPVDSNFKILQIGGFIRKGPITWEFIPLPDPRVQITIDETNVNVYFVEDLSAWFGWGSCLFIYYFK